MMLTAMLLHFLYKLPVWVRWSLSEVVLVLWLWCWPGWIFDFFLFLYTVVTAAQITIMSQTHSCIRFKFWKSSWSLQLLKILSVMWECKFSFCVSVIKGWARRECCTCHALDSEDSASNFQTHCFSPFNYHDQDCNMRNTLWKILLSKIVGGWVLQERNRVITVIYWKP